jgi:uncharacterized membrane protein YeiH
MSLFLQFLKWPGGLPPASELHTPLVAWLDLAAVTVCAVTGVLAARSKQMDLIGITVIAVVSALGGGTIRDVLLGKLPVFWVDEPLGVVAAMVSGWLTFLLFARVRISSRAFQFPDALGLALFTVVGAEKSLSTGHGWLVSTLMGVITGVFGGVLRDMICREVPSVFTRSELYATASLAGSLAFVISRGAGLAPLSSVVMGLCVVIALRLAAMRWQWKLPGFSDSL